MERARMPSRTVFRYAVHGISRPVLILQPREEVWPNEVVGTRDRFGQKLQVSYVRGTATSTPGMLGIVYNNGTDDERVSELEKLRDINQSDLLRSELGRHLLPNHAVAIVVYPRTIQSTWAGWKNMRALLERPRTEAENRAVELRREQLTKLRAKEAARRALVLGPLEEALEQVGANADIEFALYSDDDDKEFAEAELSVMVNMPLKEFIKILPIDLPGWVPGALDRHPF